MYLVRGDSKQLLDFSAEQIIGQPLHPERKKKLVFMHDIKEFCKNLPKDRYPTPPPLPQSKNSIVSEKNCPDYRHYYDFLITIWQSLLSNLKS